MLHWLILIPYYFFLALSLALSFVLVARLVRAPLSANHLVTAAVLLALGGVSLPLATGWAVIDDYTTRGFVLLATASFLLAALDTLLATALPLPLDRELEGV